MSYIAAALALILISSLSATLVLAFGDISRFTDILHDCRIAAESATACAQRSADVGVWICVATLVACVVLYGLNRRLGTTRSTPRLGLETFLAGASIALAVIAMNVVH